MLFIDPLTERIRKYISRKVLDLVENLPKFQGGRIHYMQIIREHERKLADQLNEKSKQPENASINLRSVTLVFCYEFEQFTSVHKSLRRAFPGNRKLIERIDEIRKREDAIDGASWSNLGTIIGKNNKYLIPNVIKQSELPENVESVRVSHHRLLPSLASLEFTILVNESFQKELSKLAESYYLPTSISASLWPNKLFRGHSTSYASGAESAVSQRLREFVTTAGEWLMQDLRLNASQIHISAAIRFTS